jgi:hypothetical protein
LKISLPFQKKSKKRRLKQSYWSFWNPAGQPKPEEEIIIVRYVVKDLKNRTEAEK